MIPCCWCPFLAAARREAEDARRDARQSAAETRRYRRENADLLRSVLRLTARQDRARKALEDEDGEA